MNNKSFVLLDKNNNLQKNATAIVKFNYDGKDYLVYSIEENSENDQIFVSKLVVNSEGKYFIDNLLSDEKGKLNNIVYNIIILIPTEAQKGSTFDSLTTSFLDKLSVKLLSGLPNMDVQEYFSNCSVAITNKSLVSSAVKFYDENLNKPVETVPTWTAPVEVTAPTVILDSGVSAQESVTLPNLNLQSEPVQEHIISSSVVDDLVSVSTTQSVSVDAEVPSNSQSEKIAIISDPSLGLPVQQPNFDKIKEAGFANNKYIIIGTVCLVLAVAVVITAYFLIKNM